MTLSIGDLVRKQKRDDSGPVENELHVLFEVLEVYSGWDPARPGQSVQVVKLLVRE